MKKIIAYLLTAAMLVPSIASAAPSFGEMGKTPIVVPSDIQNDNILEEQDEFIFNSDLGEPTFFDTFDAKRPIEWDYRSNVELKDGEVVVIRDRVGEIFSKFDLWENFVMEFDFCIKELSPETQGGWFGPNIRGTHVMIHQGIIQYNSEESGVQDGPTYFEELIVGEKYSMKVEASEYKAVLYLKKKNSNLHRKDWLYINIY